MYFYMPSASASTHQIIENSGTINIRVFQFSVIVQLFKQISINCKECVYGLIRKYGQKRTFHGPDFDCWNESCQDSCHSILTVLPQTSKMGDYETKSLGHQQQRPRPQLQRSYSVKPRKESSWQSLKAASFRVANAVVLPKPRRTLPSGAVSRSSSIRTKSRSIALQPMGRNMPSEPPTPEGDTFLNAPTFPGPMSRARALLPPLPERQYVTKSIVTGISDEEEASKIGLYSDAELAAAEDGEMTEEDSLQFRHLSKKSGPSHVSRFLPARKSSASAADPSERSMPMPMAMARDMPPTISSFGDPLDKEGEDFLEEVEEEDEDLMYNDFYNCMPPPIFMFCITMAELGFFIYHTRRLINDPKHGYVGKYGPAPLDSRLIYDPRRRYEVWRYFTYAMVHSGYMHIINNVVVQIVLGVLLELVHKWWRVLAIYLAGVLAGSLATSISDPYNYLAGASAGVYALIAAHLSTVILNWNEMEYPWLRVLLFVAFLIHDAGTAFYITFVTGEKTNVGYACHLGGAVAGLLVGIHVLKNLQWTKWEEILWYTSVVICIVLFGFAVLWNILRADLFP
ncbi:unnamed protein product [Orchesella dallaii]|uniref:Peptidase S54 rhomboid domain-containing protein n=1 Tax=Orchesella dallaii TaxID=48710 RepID=A0ABP1RCW8_9HEXA